MTHRGKHVLKILDDAYTSGEENQVTINKTVENTFYRYKTILGGNYEQGPKRVGKLRLFGV